MAACREYLPHTDPFALWVGAALSHRPDQPNPHFLTSLGGHRHNSASL